MSAGREEASLAAARGHDDRAARKYGDLLDTQAMILAIHEGAHDTDGRRRAATTAARLTRRRAELEAAAARSERR